MFTICLQKELRLSIGVNIYGASRGWVGRKTHTSKHARTQARGIGKGVGGGGGVRQVKLPERGERANERTPIMIEKRITLMSRKASFAACTAENKVACLEAPFTTPPRLN